MSSIDRRVVEMQFENKQFENGIQTSLRSLASLKKGLNLDKSAKSLEGLKKASKDFSLAGLASGIETITNRFSAMGIAGITAMQRITNAAITTGKRVVSALTIDPVRSGLQEYETQINAIQTIMSNTRKDFASSAEAMTAVNNALDQLNKYADMTIYNFTEMTRNIGTFTAAGVKLETATSAIKGIANLGAVSGSSSQQVSTAMYQMSQALAAGTVRLMDWNSLVNAGMGGQVLQDSLKETARVHGVAIDQMIKEEGSFRETLQKGWLTSEIMLETLQKFTGDLTKEQLLSMKYTEKQAEEIIALGQDAKNAATKVKTFTQLIDTLKEALGSGWAQSWEYIIGNFEEAREVWTRASDAISGVINKNSEARNELLKAWHDLGGRNDLIEGIFNIFSGLYGIVRAVGAAMRDIFPKTTVDDLLEMSAAVKEFGDRLKYILRFRDVLTGQDTVENVIEGLKESIELTRNLKRGLSGDDVKVLQEKLAKLGYEVGEIDGIFGPKTEAALKKFQTDMGLVVDGIFGKKSHESLIEELGVGEAGVEFEKVSRYATVFGETLEKVRRIARGVFAVFDIGGQAISFVFDIFRHGISLMAPIGNAFFEVAAAIGDCFVNLSSTIRESGIFTDWLGAIKQKLAPFGESMKKAGESILRFFGIGDAFEDLTDAIDTFPELWKKISESVQSSEIWDKLDRAMLKVRNTMVRLSPHVRAFFSNIKAALGEKFQALMQGAAEKIPQWIDAIGEFFINLIDKISPFVAKIPEYAGVLKNFFGDTFKNVKTFAGKVPGFLSKIGKFFSGLYKQIKESEKFQAAYTKITEVLTKFVTMVKDFFIGLKETISGENMDGKSIGEQFRAFFEYIFKPFAKIGDWFKNIFSNIEQASDWADSFISKLGPGGLIGVFIAALGAASGYRLITKGTKLIDGINDIVGLLKTKFKGEKTTQPIAKSIMQIALSIGILVAAVYVLGKMDPGVFKRGAITVGAIIAALAGLAIVAGIFLKKDAAEAIGSAGKALYQLAIAIGIITAAIWVLGNSDPKKLWSGAGVIAAIMASLLVFTIALKAIKVTTMDLKGLVSLSIAVGILAALAMLIGKTDFWKFMSGVIGMTAVMAALVLFAKLTGKAGTSIVQYKGLFSLSIAVGILAGIAWLISKTDFWKFMGGVLGLTAVMAALLGFVALLNHFNKANVFKMTGLFAVAAAVGLMAAIAFLIGTVPSSTMINGILGLIGIMGALALFTKVAGKVDWKGTVSMLVVIAGMAAAIGVFAYAISKVKDIDPKVMSTFALSVGGLVGGLSLIAGVLGTLGISTVLMGIVAMVALVAAIGGIVAAIGALKKVEGFEDLINGGATLIGTAIGNFVGSLAGAFEASKIKAMTEGLKEFGTSDVDKDAIASTLDAVKLISDFEEAMPDKSIGTKIANAFLGSDLTNFSNDMVAFGSAAKSLSESMSGVTIDQATVQTAVDAAGLINGLADAVGTISVGEAIAKLIAGGSPFAQFCTNMESFGTSIGNLQNGVAGLADSTIENDTKAATKAATAVSKLIEAISGMDIETNKSKLAKFFTGDGKVDTVFSQIVTLGSSIETAAKSFSGLGETALIDDTEAIIGAVTSIANFLNWLSSDEVYIQESDMYGGIASNFDELMEQTLTIADYIVDFNTKTKDVDASKFESLIASVNAIAASASTLSGMNLSKEQLSGLSESIQTIGTELSTALSSGFGELSTDTGSVSVVGDSMLAAIGSYEDDFIVAGYNLGQGLAQGMRKSRLIAAAAAVAVAKAALEAAKNTLGIESPSKEFAKFGMYSDQGFAAGLIRYSGVVNKAAEGIGYSALNSLRSTLDNLSMIINSDIDTTPVIRPVMDLSNVSSGASAINSMLSGTGSIGGYLGTSSRILAGTINTNTANNQNGVNAQQTPTTSTTDNSINFPGATFNVRSEQDIYSLASEIAVLSISQQRSLGAAVTINK